MVETLHVPGENPMPATFINAGIHTIFLNAKDLGYTGTELQDAINGDPTALARFEKIRAHGALQMGLIKDLHGAAKRQHTAKIAFVAPPASYTTSSGKQIEARDIDLLVRALSIGKLHHAMMCTAAVAIGVAAAIPDTLVNLAASGEGDSSNDQRQSVRFGHPSGTLLVGAEAQQNKLPMASHQGPDGPQRTGLDGRVGIGARGSFERVSRSAPIFMLQQTLEAKKQNRNKSLAHSGG